MGVLRVFAGFVVAIAMTGAWMLLACLVMAVSLYIARLVPLAGRHKSRARIDPHDPGSEI
jgi:hypothetical protein